MVSGVWWLACLVGAVLLGAALLMTPPNPDSAIFDYMGWRMLSGDRLYVDVIEQNWPGAVWLHALATALFGNSWWSFRLFDYLLLLLASAVLFWTGSKSGIRRTGALAAVLYPVMYVTATPWMTGQRDAMAAHLLLMGLWLYLSVRGRWSVARMTAFGALCALVVMVRPTYLLFPALLLLSEGIAHGSTGRPVSALVRGGLFAFVGFAVPLLVLALYGHRTGGLAGWWEAAILFNLDVYSGSASLSQVVGTLTGTARDWHWYIVLGGVGALLWWRTGDRWAWLGLAALAATCLVSFLVQGKAFGYHLAGVLPILALFAAHTVAWAIEAARTRRSWWLVAVAALVLGVAVVGSARKLRAVAPQIQWLTGGQDRWSYLARSEFRFDGMDMADLVRVADHIRQRTNETDTILVWNRGVWINYLAQRAMPIPFATVGALAEFRQPTEGLALRWLELLGQRLDCAPPAYVVVGRDRGWFPGERSSAAGSAPSIVSDRRVFDVLLARYEVETHIGGAQIWRLAKPTSSPCP